MGDADAVAVSLGVPCVDRAAFVELYKKLRDRKGTPALHEVKAWRHILSETPAEAQVRAFIEAHNAEIAEFLETSGADRNVFEQRLMFTAVYGQGHSADPLSLPDALTRVQADISAAAENKVPKGVLFILKEGSFDNRHGAIRKAAFPYKPACCTCTGDPTVDCYAPDGTTLVGYIAPDMRMGYIDDLSVAPEWQGRGIAKGLVCGAAERLLERRVTSISLHVRAANYPAIALYRDCLGFAMSENEFPAWYDWHGGYAMRASCRDIAAQVPQHFRNGDSHEDLAA